MQGSIASTCRLGSFQQASVRSQQRQALAVRCSASRKAETPAAKPAGLLAAGAAALAIALAPQPALAAIGPIAQPQVSHVASIRAFEVAKPAPQVVADVAEVATDLKFEPEKAIGGPGLSAAQEAASRANPPPFDPAVIGGTAGILLLAFGIGTGRADPQLKMNSSSGSGSSGGGGSSGVGASGGGEDEGKVAEVQGRKKQARAWIGDWQKRTKKQ